MPQSFQIASRELGIDRQLIRVAESSTSSIPNSIVTAASMSSDIYGNAVKVSNMIIVTAFTATSDPIICPSLPPQLC